MNAEQAVTIIKRMDAIWPRKKDVVEGEYDEWLAFLKPLDGPVALRAVNELRDTMKWHPAMSDFKSAYFVASTLPLGDRPELPGKVEESTSERNKALYGVDPMRWVYCWRCNMAIPLEDWREDDPKRGLVHPGRKCPRKGTAPMIPNDERLKRDEYFRRHGISVVGK